MSNGLKLFLTLASNEEELKLHVERSELLH